MTRLPEWIISEPDHYISLLEPLSRGTAFLYYADDQAAVIRLEEQEAVAAWHSSRGRDTAMKNLPPHRVLCICEDIGEGIPVFSGYGKVVADYNYVYHAKRHIDFTLPEGVTIRPLDERLLDYLDRSYVTETSREYKKRRLENGMLGLFLQETVCGYVGLHPEGTIGLLQVEERFRRRGYGYFLEAAMINNLLDKGWLPFAQVHTDNEPSKALQNKLGLDRIAGRIFWAYPAKIQ